MYAPPKQSQNRRLLSTEQSRKEKILELKKNAEQSLKTADRDKIQQTVLAGTNIIVNDDGAEDDDEASIFSPSILRFAKISLLLLID